MSTTDTRRPVEVGDVVQVRWAETREEPFQGHVSLRYIVHWQDAEVVEATSTTFTCFAEINGEGPYKFGGLQPGAGRDTNWRWPEDAPTFTLRKLPPESAWRGNAPYKSNSPVNALPVRSNNTKEQIMASEEKTTLNVGDVVRLKSGSPLLTVCKLNKNDYDRLLSVGVKWFEPVYTDYHHDVVWGPAHEEVFPLEALVIHESYLKSRGDDE